MTDNHGYETPPKGATDWHIPLNENFERLDSDVEIRDVESNLGTYTPKSGAKFLATDTGAAFVGDGTQWRSLSSTGNSPAFDSVRSARLNNEYFVGGGGYDSIQAAHDEMPDRGGIIRLVDVVEETDITITKPCTIVGQGQGEYDSATSYKPGAYLDASGGRGIHVDAGGVVLRDLHVRNAQEYGIKVGSDQQKVFGTNLLNVSADNNEGHGFLFTGQWGQNHLDITAWRNGGHGIFVDITQSSANNYFNAVSSDRFRAFYNGQDGVRFAGLDQQGSEIVGNYIGGFVAELNDWWGLYVEEGSRFGHNKFEGYGLERNFVDTAGMSYFPPPDSTYEGVVRGSHAGNRFDFREGVGHLLNATSVPQTATYATTEHRGGFGKVLPPLSSGTMGGAPATSYNTLSYADRRSGNQENGDQWTVSTDSAPSRGDVIDAFRPDQKNWVEWQPDDLPASITVDLKGATEKWYALGAQWTYPTQAPDELVLEYYDSADSTWYTVDSVADLSYDYTHQWGYAGQDFVERLRLTFDSGSKVRLAKIWGVSGQFDYSVFMKEGGGEFKDDVSMGGNLLTGLAGNTYRPASEPSTSELADGEGMVYVSDGTGTGESGDLVYAVNVSGIVETTVLAHRSDAN